VTSFLEIGFNGKDRDLDAKRQLWRKTENSHRVDENGQKTEWRKVDVSRDPRELRNG
jgi:hypothetical protein